MLTLRASETSILTSGPVFLSMIPTFLASIVAKLVSCFPAGYGNSLDTLSQDHEINAIGFVALGS